MFPRASNNLQTTAALKRSLAEANLSPDREDAQTSSPKRARPEAPLPLEFFADFNKPVPKLINLKLSAVLKRLAEIELTSVERQFVTLLSKECMANPASQALNQFWESSSSLPDLIDQADKYDLLVLVYCHTNLKFFIKYTSHITVPGLLTKLLADIENDNTPYVHHVSKAPKISALESRLKLLQQASQQSLTTILNF